MIVIRPSPGDDSYSNAARCGDSPAHRARRQIAEAELARLPPSAKLSSMPSERGNRILASRFDAPGIYLTGLVLTHHKVRDLGKADIDPGGDAEDHLLKPMGIGTGEPRADEKIALSKLIARPQGEYHDFSACSNITSGTLRHAGTRGDFAPRGSDDRNQLQQPKAAARAGERGLDTFGPCFRHPQPRKTYSPKHKAQPMV